MAFSPYSDRAGGGSQRSFTATAIEFTPKRIEAKTEVLNSSFITQTIPRADRYAGIIGLCTVPEERAGMNDLGWHVADFLAFRALFCGENPPKAQTWLSQCDIAALVEANPERYVHGKDKRLVGFAAKAEMYQSSKGLVERGDNIQVETSAEILKDKFVTAIKGKMAILKKKKYPLVLIICGMTSLEQDIYFGKLDIDHRCTMSNLRSALGDDINLVEAIVVTPSLFSAGWQMNTAFGHPPSASVRANRAEFLARQFGGLFAKDLVKDFLGWKCPVLDVDKVEPSIRIGERFPGPAWPSDEVKALISKLQVHIHSYLIGQFSAYNMNHSFSFDNANDEWSALIAQREKPRDYRTLDWYEEKWNKLPSAQSVESTDDGLAFLGNAFGGTRMSQVNHLRYLIEESYLAWPDHWASNFGHETKKDIERFLNRERLEDLDCHEIFNVLEHRATTSTLADMIIQYFDLPMPHNQRCRDWDYLRWKEELPEADRSSLIKYFGTVLAYVPGPNVPPGVNPNHLSKPQRRLENAANYVRASLSIRFLTSKDSSKVAIDNIHNFIQEIKLKQAELLVANPIVYQMCCSWLKAIEMPVREFDTAVSATRKPQGVATSAIPTGILDGDNEYDVQQVPLSKAPNSNSTVMDNPQNDLLHGQKQFSMSFAPAQQPSPVPLALHRRSSAGILDDGDEYYPAHRPRLPFATRPSRHHPLPVPFASGHSQEEETPAAESPAIVITQEEQDTIAEASEIVITHTRQDESVGFNQDVVEHELKVARLIETLQTTNDTAEREKLTEDLLELLQSHDSLLTEAARSNGVSQDSAAKAIEDDTTVAAVSVTETKIKGRHSDGKKESEADKGTMPKGISQVSALKPQDPNSALPPHKRTKRPEPSEGAAQ